MCNVIICILPHQKSRVTTSNSCGATSVVRGEPSQSTQSISSCHAYRYMPHASDIQISNLPFLQRGNRCGFSFHSKQVLLVDEEVWIVSGTVCKYQLAPFHHQGIQRGNVGNGLWGKLCRQPCCKPLHQPSVRLTKGGEEHAHGAQAAQGAYNTVFS